MKITVHAMNAIRIAERAIGAKSQTALPANLGNICNQADVSIDVLLECIQIKMTSADSVTRHARTVLEETNQMTVLSVTLLSRSISVSV